MRLTVEYRGGASESQWDTFYESSAGATYFQSREWADVWRDYTDGKVAPDPVLVLFSDGKRALIPFSVHSRLRGRVRRYLLSPGDTYGGWLSPDRLTADHAFHLARVILEHGRSLFWKSSPFEPLAPRHAELFTEQDETQVLDLAGGFDAVLRGFTKGHRAAARQAEREGVEVLVADRREHWEGYFEAYEDSLRRWGPNAFTRLGWTFFEELWLRDSRSVRLWLARTDEGILAGILCLCGPQHVVYWHGAALESGLPMRPVHLLVREALRDACQRGMRWFDFNPSGNLPGVRHFKKGFGARSLPCPNVRTTSRLWRLLESRAPAAIPSSG